MIAAGSSALVLAATSRAAGFGLVVLLGCAAPLIERGEPATVVSAQDVRGRLERLVSFSFRYRYHTDVPFSISADYTGIREVDDHESWSGRSGRRGEVARVELRASGADQYELVDGRWQRTERGTETRILEQAAAAVRGDSLRLVRCDERRLVYSFEPSAPILDPAQSKRLTGTLEVDRRTGLPLSLRCGDSLRTAELLIEFGRFGRAGRVRVPFVPVVEVRLRPRSRIGHSQTQQVVSTIRARFGALDWQHRIGSLGDGWRLELGRGVPSGEMEQALAIGKVELWRASWVSDTAAQNAPGLMVGGDAARRVALVRVIAANGEASAVADLLLPMAPALTFKLTVPDSVPDGRLVALVLDGRVLDVTNQHDARLRFADVGGIGTVRVLAALAVHSPLPVALIADWR